MERDTPVTVVRVDYLCDTCGELMKSTGIVLTSWPAKYPHTCANGHGANLDEMYPVVGYRAAPEVKP